MCPQALAEVRDITRTPDLPITPCVKLNSFGGEAEENEETYNTLKFFILDRIT